MTEPKPSKLKLRGETDCCSRWWYSCPSLYNRHRKIAANCRKLGHPI